MSDSEKFRVLSKLITLLTPYKIEDTVFYNIVKRREPDIITKLCFDNTFLLKSSSMYADMVKKLYIHDSAYNFISTFGFKFRVSNKSGWNYIGDLGETEITKENIDKHIFRRIGIYNDSTSYNLELNLRILVFADKITQEEAKLIRDSHATYWLTEKDIYRVIHKQIFGIEIEEEFKRWKQLSADIEILKKEHELAITVIKKESEEEKNKQIDDFKASLQQELDTKNKQIDDYVAQVSAYEQRVNTLNLKCEQLQLELTEEKSKVSKLEKENDKLRSQLKLIFSVREEIGASKLEEHDERINVIENTLEEHDEQLRNIEE